MAKKSPIKTDLLQDLRHIIDAGRTRVAVQVNSTLILVYWQVGKRIRADILQNQRAEYGKEVIVSLAADLVRLYGKSFEQKNLRRMIQFAEIFPELEIVAPLARQLSWSHFLVLLPIENEEQRLFYAQKAMEGLWGKRELRKQIELKAYERSEIADSQLPMGEVDLKSVFKDPYFLDFLGLKDGYLEKDVEAAIIKELELFILELGMGFTFVERQKRMIIDGEDHYLDLVFYHRKLRRLVAVDLKLRQFRAEDKGQMELYLRWLDKYDRAEGEAPPIGLILCASAGREKVELLQPIKDGILVSQYWTELPAKEVLERKLHDLLLEARERIARKKLGF